MRKNILITGTPRSGKSTLLKKVISNYDKKVGFITNEICENGERIGFEIETNAGEKSNFANVNFKTNFKVSRYFVDVNNLEEIIPKVAEFTGDDILFLDEIGQMELFSEKFKQLVLKYLDSSNICIVTLSKVYNDEFTEQIKNRDDIILVELSEENRVFKEKYLKTLIRKIAKAKRYLNEPERFTVNQKEATMTTDHGIKKLIKQKGRWVCHCEFFQENNICSHVIALDEYLKTRAQ